MLGECLFTLHHRPEFTAVPPPTTHPAITSTSEHAMPAELTQISLQRPGTSKRVRLVSASHSGWIPGLLVSFGYGLRLLTSSPSV